MDDSIVTNLGDPIDGGRAKKINEAVDAFRKVLNGMDRIPYYTIMVQGDVQTSDDPDDPAMTRVHVEDAFFASNVAGNGVVWDAFAQQFEKGRDRTLRKLNPAANILSILEDAFLDNGPEEAS